MVTLVAVALLASFFGLATAAASVTAVCDYADWTAFKGIGVCQIWGNLQAVCDPNASVPPLDTSSSANAHYPSPNGTGATPCQCNVVAYNLMAGCSWCQPDVFSSNWVSETVWKAGCSSYNPTGLPTQASSLSSSVPSWAFEVQNGNSWGSFEASTIAAAGGTGTAGGIFPTGTRTGGGGFGSTAFVPSPTGPFSGGDDGDGLDDPFDDNIGKNLGKVVGIAVGITVGVWLLFFGTGLTICLVRQRRRKAWYGAIAAHYANGGRMGDVQAAQPLLANSAYPNPFTSPSPSAQAFPTSNQTTTPMSESSHPSAHTYPSQQYQQPMAGQYQPPAPGQYQEYDSSLLYQQGYPNPTAPQVPTGSRSHIPEL